MRPPWVARDVEVGVGNGDLAPTFSIKNPKEMIISHLAGVEGLIQCCHGPYLHCTAKDMKTTQFVTRAHCNGTFPSDPYCRIPVLATIGQKMKMGLYSYN